jgi:serine/threonine protein kinase/Tol biopolymer transport system component
MTPERWQQVDRLLQEALEREPEARASFLSEACRHDDSLRREVEALLAAGDRAGGFLQSPALEDAGALINDSNANSILGRRIGCYQVISQLGAGGMGEVYLAQDTRLGRKVAIKLLPSFFTKDEQRLGRFQQEARAASALNHPNIITIYDIGEADSIHFIATEFIEGETLRTALDKGVQLSQALDVAIQTSSALHSAHQAGIAHRDIKPENIMVRTDGYVKVLDFGLAKLTEKQPLTIGTEAATIARVETDPGTVMGTARYMSPEQARGQEVDGRSDIFSLGVVIYEMVAGRAPFEGKTTSDVIAAILEKQPLPLARYEPGAPTEIQWIVTKALRKDRDERYQTIKEMLSDLRDLKQDLDAQSRSERRAALDASDGVSHRDKTRQRAAETTKENPLPTGEVTMRTTSSAEIILSEIKRHKAGAAFTLLALIVMIAGIAFGLYKYLGLNSSNSRAGAPRFTALSTGGKVGDQIIDGDVSISPDGKYIAYAAFDDKQQLGLWIKQVSTNSQVQIVPPASVDFFGTSFSRDGEFVYYVKAEKRRLLARTLYRVPVIGGISTKVMDDVRGTVDFSPDGKRFAFLRDLAPRGEMLLMFANTDGSGEPSLLTTIKQPQFFAQETAPSWSPDGKMIACALKTHAGTEYATVVGISVDDGQVRPLTSEKWSDMGRVLWAADGSGLIFTATVGVNKIGTQIWYLSYPEGKARRITNDLNGYGGVSLGMTADSGTIATLQIREFAQIWTTAPNQDASSARQISPGGRTDGNDSLSWMQDGRILYSARAGDNSDLWIVNADGAGPRQLTNDEYWESDATASPDGRYIVFQSDRTGNLNLWRTDVDGTNPKPLTDGSAVDTYPTISPDSQWVVFISNRIGGMPTLWKVAISGGSPTQLTGDFSLYPCVSPDSKLIAYGQLVEQASGSPRPRLVIIPFDGGKPVKTLDLPDSTLIWRGGTQWMPDGRAICFTNSPANVPNVWAQPLDGGPLKQLTNFKSDFIYRFAFSSNGKQLAVSRGRQTSDLVLIKDFR